MLNFATDSQLARLMGKWVIYWKRTFKERFLWASDLANLTNPKRYGNMNVHDGCIISFRIIAYCCLYDNGMLYAWYIIMRHDVGYLCCLSLGLGNARAGGLG